MKIIRQIISNLLFLLTSSIYASNYYVTPSGTGTKSGNNWLNALDASGFQSALASALIGDEFFLAEGTYNPTLSSDRTISFNIKSGISIYGGYYGTGYSFRAPRLHPTILSGDIGIVGDINDNSYCIINISNSPNAIKLNGLTIENSNAVGVSTGGGIFLHSAALNSSNLIIENCDFKSNLAIFGGAIAIWAEGDVNVDISNSTFENNASQLSGGAIYTYAQISSYAVVNLINCTINDNHALSGGSAVHASNLNELNILNSSFSLNGDANSVVIYCKGDTASSEQTHTFIGKLNIDNCAFEYNTSQSNLFVNQLYSVNINKTLMQKNTLSVASIYAQSFNYFDADSTSIIGFHSSLTEVMTERGVYLNGASDDAAGIAIVTNMSSQITGLNAAIKNDTDGIIDLRTPKSDANSQNKTPATETVIK
jgi:hypothetical protein